MSEWNAMSHEAKDNVLRVLGEQMEDLFTLAEDPARWEAATACPEWQVRDIVGHLVDVTESYFVAFDVARGNGSAAEPLGLPGMAARLNKRALSFRDTSQAELLQRLRGDAAKMTELVRALGPDEWAGLTPPHTYMGPLPAFFYPAFQLMDYTVHAWDIRRGAGQAQALPGAAADLLAPFMFILWGATADVSGVEPFEVGIRIHGVRGGEFVVSVGPDGLAHQPAAETGLGALPAVIEFDAGSFVLAAFGRCDAGTVRGDAAVAQRFLNLFFRI